MRKILLVLFIFLIFGIFSAFLFCGHNVGTYKTSECISLGEYFPSQTKKFGIRYVDGVFQECSRTSIEILDNAFFDLVECVEDNFFVNLFAYPRPYVMIELAEENKNCDGIKCSIEQYFYCDGRWSELSFNAPNEKCSGGASFVILPRDCGANQIFLIVLTPDLRAVKHELMHYAQHMIVGQISDGKDDPFRICQ